MSKWKALLGFPETRGTTSFLLVLVIDALGSGLFVPLSILYFQVTAAFSLPVIGLLLTVATLCTLPITFVTGSLVDRFGARRLTALSQLMQALGLFGYLFVHTLPILLLTALLVTAGNRMFYAAHTALVVEIALPQERDRWYGLVGAIRNVGLGIGGFLAGLVLATKDTGFYHLLIAVSSICYLAAGSLLLRQLEIGQRQHKRESGVPYSTVIRHRLFLVFLLSTIAFPLCALMLGTALPIYITQAVHAPVWIVGTIFVLNSILSIGCQTIIVRLLEPYHRAKVIAVAALIWTSACLLFALALIIPHSSIAAYLFFAATLYTLASLFYTPTASALVAELGPIALRGRYLATYEFSWGVASSLTPALFTVLYAVTPNLPWLVLATLTAISGISVILIKRRLPERAI